jgi:anti-sigma regulatory factor (Ser/Thr protein kinase)
MCIMGGRVAVDQGFRRLAVPFSRGAARAARSELSRTLRERRIRQSVIDDAVVVVSELVTNAVRHATPGPDGQVGVEWALDSSRLWLRVTDGGRGRSGPRVQHADAVGGRGLSIVAALADAWDFERHESGTTVTAVFDLV